jgi:hypothetical protein
VTKLLLFLTFILTLDIWVVDDLTEGHAADLATNNAPPPAISHGTIWQAYTQFTGQVNSMTKQRVLRRNSKRDAGWKQGMAWSATTVMWLMLWPTVHFTYFNKAYQLIVKKLENKIVYNKETVECYLIFWMGSRGRVYCHTAKLQSYLRVSINEVLY